MDAYPDGVYFATLAPVQAADGVLPAVAKALRDHAPGIRLLRKETVRLPLSEPLYLAGIDDPGRDWTARGVDLPDLEELAEKMPGDGPTVLLVHRPECWNEAIEQHRGLLQDDPARLASIRALLRISHGRGSQMGIAAGLAVLRALGAATPEERIQAPARPPRAYL